MAKLMDPICGAPSGQRAHVLCWAQESFRIVLSRGARLQEPPGMIFEDIPEYGEWDLLAAEFKQDSFVQKHWFQVGIRILIVAARLARAACLSFLLVQVCMAVIEADADAVMKNCQAPNLEHPQQATNFVWHMN